MIKILVFYSKQWPQEPRNPKLLNLFKIEIWELELDPPSPRFYVLIAKKVSIRVSPDPSPPDWDNVLKSAIFFFDFIPNLT